MLRASSSGINAEKQLLIKKIQSNIDLLYRYVKDTYTGSMKEVMRLIYKYTVEQIDSDSLKEGKTEWTRERKPYLEWVQQQLREQKELYSAFLNKATFLLENAQCREKPGEEEENKNLQSIKAIDELTGQLRQLIVANFRHFEAIILRTPIDLAVSRLREKNLCVKDLQSSLKLVRYAQPKALLKYVGPVVGCGGTGALIAFLAGVIFGGWGAIPIAIGFGIGMTWSAYNIHKEKERRQHTEATILRLVEEKKNMYERFVQIGKELDQGDLIHLCEDLSLATTTFVRISQDIFPEIRYYCSICGSEDSRKESREESQSQTEVEIDVVKSTSTEGSEFQDELEIDTSEKVKKEKKDEPKLDSESDPIPSTDLARGDGCLLHFFHFSCLLQWQQTCRSHCRPFTCPNCLRVSHAILKLTETPIKAVASLSQD